MGCVGCGGGRAQATAVWEIGRRGRAGWRAWRKSGAERFRDGEGLEVQGVGSECGAGGQRGREGTGRAGGRICRRGAKIMAVGDSGWAAGGS